VPSREHRRGTLTSGPNDNRTRLHTLHPKTQGRCPPAYRTQPTSRQAPPQAKP